MATAYQQGFTAIAQTAAGTTTIAAAGTGLRVHIIGICLVATAAGTLKFSDTSGDLTGAMSLAVNGGIAIAAAPGEEEHKKNSLFYGSVGQPVTLTTATGYVAGWVTYEYR